MNQRTVYMVDDNPDFLESAQWWLEGADYRVVAFDSPHAALQALPQAWAQGGEAACLLLDVRMPELSGLALHDLLRERGLPLPVVYMTGHADIPLAVEAMQKGAVTFIEKPFTDASLQQALALAFARGAASATPAAPALPALPAPPAAPAAPAPETAAAAARFARLTPREREVVALVMQSKQNKVIADRLNISIKTVELHRKNAMSKLGARSVVELTRTVVTVQGG